MNKKISIESLTVEAFGPFGNVIEATGDPDLTINRGLCFRYHDRARMDFGEGGRCGLSLFLGEPQKLPIKLDMVECHPEGSQAFIPIHLNPFLVVVAPSDEEGLPGTPRAFMTAPGQCVNYYPGTWHGVLMPLHKPGLFAVIDRIGNTTNLKEHYFNNPFIIE